MENLRGLRAHPRREARREHDGQRRVGHARASGWGARIRTWDSGSKVRRLTAWPRPKGHGSKDRGERWGLCPPRTPQGLLAPLDQLGDSSTALAAQLRIPLATELRLARLPALPAEL